MTYPSHVMPFGKHRGEPIDAIPTSYLTWLSGQYWVRPDLKAAVARELYRRRQRALALANLAGEQLPEMPPMVVCGVELSGVEAALFQRACAAGELVITPDLPASSPLPKAWELWCHEQWREARVREITWGEIEAELRGE